MPMIADEKFSRNRPTVRPSLNEEAGKSWIADDATEHFYQETNFVGHTKTSSRRGEDWCKPDVDLKTGVNDGPKSCTCFTFILDAKALFKRTLL